MVAKEGEPFRLTCSSEGGSPDPVIQWFKDGNPIQGQVTWGGSRDKATTNTLDIRPTISDDRSFYRCTVWNRAIREEDKLSTDYSLTVHYIPRVKVGPFNPLAVLKGSDVSMTCSVDANPPANKIRWYKNDRLVSPEVNHTVVNVLSKDSGSYVCIADNGVMDSRGNPGKGELDLSVLFPPIVSVISEKEVKSGESISIPCNIESNPEVHTVIWTKEGDSSFRQTGKELHISRSSSSDAGRYFCTASNSMKPSGSLNGFEQSSNASVLVRVQHSPGNTAITPLNPVAVSGRPFTLTCGSSPPGWPRAEYRWWKEGNDKFDLSRAMNLSFNPVHVSNEGRYYCQPFNVLGKGTIGSAFLTVNEAPSVTLPMPPSLVRKTGDQAFSMTCRARGKPKPVVSWYHSGQSISLDNNRYRVETKETLEDANVYVLTTTLHLESLSKKTNALAAQDSGKYACLFDNDIGTVAKAETTLRVEHSPIVRHTYNKVAFDVGENASLQCKMSSYPEPKFEWSFDGKILDGSRKYYIEVTQDREHDDIFIGTLMIRNVAASDYGHYLCRAWNGIGDNDDEKTNLELVRKSAPDAPTQIEATEILSDSVTIRWKESFNGGYANTEFVISYSHDGDRWRNESCRTMNPCRVTGLESRSDYVFRVMAINAGGHSGFSDEIGVTTKINLKDMPNASEAYYDSSRDILAFRVESSSLRLVAKIEVREVGQKTGYWIPLTIVPIVTDVEEIHLKPSNSGYSDMRIMLCLQANDSWCGYEHLVKMDASNSVFLRENKGLSVESFLSGVGVIAGIVFCGVLAITCCCCISKRFNPEKKLSKNSDLHREHHLDHLDDVDHASKINQSLQGQQYYASHMDNKAILMNGNDVMGHDPNKLSALPLYATTGPRTGSNGHIAQNYYLTGDHDQLNDPSPSGSNEPAQSDLWMMKTEDGQEIPVSYHSLYGQTTSNGGVIHDVSQTGGYHASYAYTASAYNTHNDDPSSYPMTHEEQAINLKNSLCEYQRPCFFTTTLF